MQSDGKRHPREMDVTNEHKVPASIHKRTGIPRSRIRSFACCTVYSP